ncbi:MULTISPECIES: lysophospholipid acyltransferase family protein [Pedobacter]|uniref:Phospholipid/glycerol acyltransferase n=1 Tax=Pedobacter heparinus (strain ATCC 13125 / DSM 2366 / CIP 104194 / JCM 7457 / NBRC 12017 / NCIMB 9290 / NRRL B-14731 / HIM 762-3) TaxID=485917 RepID=C6Y263_PEDHD|nr:MULTISPECIES: GNAT family N-acyltransferase [Pedobacter]ACU03056.1 phospholipid/glycerol acyltransferase [Pedobacter heparinus DSM 2366]MBB5438435.1 putative hemolysin [Pedobacter sp. AK017]
MKIITTKEFAKATKIDKLGVPGLAALLMEMMKLNDINKVFSQNEHFNGLEFVDKILETIGVSIDFDEDDLKNIPKTGGFIAIANHPYGGVEGLALVKLLCTVRPEAKVMVNFILKKIPNLSEFFVAVNPFENVQHTSSISGLKATFDLLQSGTPIGIFPAGEVSTFSLDKQEITDRLWHPVVGKLIARAKVPVIPIYFHGNNGVLFNILSFIHPTLRTAKLPSEFLNKQGLKIKVRIGKPINIEDISYHKNTNKLLDFLRARTYALGTGLEEEKKLFNPINLFKIKKKPEPIIEETDRNLIVNEIEELEGFRVWQEKNYEVYIAPTVAIPNVLREIGRLREITFREVGEGTNKKIDLDNYDIYYHHLFIWDKELQNIVGAYRIGKGDEILNTMGRRGFYLSELFKIKEPFYPLLRKGIELGRSWIRKEYQQKPLPLFLLWKGILKYLLDNPQYRYMFGPVSISNNFSKFSKSLIVDYITKNHFDYELAHYVKPKNKFKADLSAIDKDLLIESSESLKDLDSLISDIENSHIKIPVLLRQYMNLNAKIICFNIDPKFSDCLDGFLVVDMQNIPAEMLEKIGKNF